MLDVLRRRVVRPLGLVAVIAAVAFLVPAADAATAGPCGTLTGTPAYEHVVVIMDENVSYNQLKKSPQASYLHSLAAQCGSELFMHAATHPSQTNYMAMTSGVASGLGIHTANDNVFHQAQVHGDTWKVYGEDMPRTCANTKVPYKTGHNPAFWYTDLQTPTNTCALYDVPMKPALDNDIANDSLPKFAWITPNICNDMHGLASCPMPNSQRIGAGDTWLSTMIPRLTAMPSYQAGQTLIVMTWDEGNGGEVSGSDCTDPLVYSSQTSCQIPTIIVSPYVTTGATDATDHNLYGLLGDVQDILGYPRLGRAVGASSLRPGLGF